MGDRRDERFIKLYPRTLDELCELYPRAAFTLVRLCSKADHRSGRVPGSQREIARRLGIRFATFRGHVAELGDELEVVGAVNADDDGAGVTIRRYRELVRPGIGERNPSQGERDPSHRERKASHGGRKASQRSTADQREQSGRSEEVKKEEGRAAISTGHPDPRVPPPSWKGTRSEWLARVEQGEVGAAVAP